MYYPAKGIDWSSVGLGSKNDAEIAREIGVATQVVWQARSRRGIAAHRGPRVTRSVTDETWQTMPLGEVPDSIIARDLNVSREYVGAARRRLGIAAFTGLTLRQDGLPCRSIYEAMYDAVLHSKGIAHEHEVAYKELGIVADLLIDGRVVEIAGMIGVPWYDRRKEVKERRYRAAGVEVTWLTREDVLAAYQQCPLRIQCRTRYCSACSTETIDLVRGTCRPCRMKSWRIETAVTQICLACRAQFKRADRDTMRKYCGRKCYWKSLELNWPSWNELDAMIAASGNVTEVARTLGMSANALHMRLRRRRERLNA